MPSQTFMDELDHGGSYWIDDDPYPVTIVMARYGGTYEGGAWLAFPMLAADVGAEQDGWAGDDLTCSEWWSDAANLPIGRGNSHSIALLDMKRRLRTGRHP